MQILFYLTINNQFKFILTGHGLNQVTGSISILLKNEALNLRLFDHLHRLKNLVKVKRSD